MAAGSTSDACSTRPPRRPGVAATDAAARFDEFYAATSRQVLHVLYAVTGDLGAAQDCTQEAYARAWARWAEVGSRDNPAAWVHVVGRNLAVSRWRHVSAGHRALARTGQPPPVAPPSEDHVAVVTALKALPIPLREAVALHYLADLSVEDIAGQTGAAVGTVKARLHRGRRQLADLLRAESGSSPAAPKGEHRG